MVSVRPKFDGYLDEYYCLSTDEKPTSDHVANGSTLVEIDTGKKYMYDKENRSWHAKSSGSSSGGGSTGGGFVLLDAAFDETSQVPYIPMPAGELFQLCMENVVLLGTGDDGYVQITYFAIDEGQYAFAAFAFRSSIVFLASDSASYPQYMLQNGSGGGAPT